MTTLQAPLPCSDAPAIKGGHSVAQGPLQALLPAPAVSLSKV